MRDESLNNPDGKTGNQETWDAGRRDAMKRLLAGSATAAAAVACSDSEKAAKTVEQTAESLVQESGVPAGPRGTPTDPDLIHPVIPWKKILSGEELEKAGAIMDVILPATENSPSMTESGGMDFVNHWVSAPFEQQRKDLEILRGALRWFDDESTRRFGKPFGDLGGDQKCRICDDVCDASKAKPEWKAGAHFFDRMRWLAMTGYYLTDAGRKDVGFVGNTAFPKFEGPPMTVLEKLGIVDEQIG